jgi:hypothetical protein
MHGSNATTEALAVAVAAGAPVLLWGAPGTGKTSLIRALAEAWDLSCEVVVASIHDPTDFSGLPVVAGGSVSLAPPRWAQRLAETGSGVLFLDELTTAPPAVQAALLRVVLERTVGDLSLPADVRVVAAANPPDQAADGWDLALPLANRFCHLDWSVGAAAFAAGLTSGWRTPDVPTLPPGWTAELPAARGVLAAFIYARPTLLLAVPDNAAAGRAWPSPRSWDLAARLLAAGRAAGVGAETVAVLVAGCVGDGPALEFLSYLDGLDLPDPEALLADPATFEVPDRGDRALAVLSAVAAAVSSDPTPARWLAGWEVVGTAARILPDVAATAGRALAACQPEGVDAPPAAGELAPVLVGAGFLGRRP